MSVYVDVIIEIPKEVLVYKLSKRVSVDTKVDNLVNILKEQFDLSQNDPHFLYIKIGRSFHYLENQKTLKQLDTKNSNVLKIGTILKASGMIIHGLVMEQLNEDGTLKTFKMKPHSSRELIIAFPDEFEEPRESPFYFLDQEDTKRFNEGFAECQSRRLGKRSFFYQDKNYHFRSQWREISTKSQEITYYTLSLPQYAIPVGLEITNPSQPEQQFKRSIIKDEQNFRFIIYLSCRSSYGRFNFDLSVKFTIHNHSDFLNLGYQDEFTIDAYQILDIWKYNLADNEPAKVQQFFMADNIYNFKSPVNNVANEVKGNQY